MTRGERARARGRHFRVESGGESWTGTGLEVAAALSGETSSTRWSAEWIDALLGLEPGASLIEDLGAHGVFVVTRLDDPRQVYERAFRAARASRGVNPAEEALRGVRDRLGLQAPKEGWARGSLAWCLDTAAYIRRRRGARLLRERAWRTTYENHVETAQRYRRAIELCDGWRLP